MARCVIIGPSGEPADKEIVFSENAAISTLITLQQKPHMQEHVDSTNKSRFYKDTNVGGQETEVEQEERLDLGKVGKGGEYDQNMLYQIPRESVKILKCGSPLRMLFQI